MAVHAGWRGLVANVIEAGLAKLREIARPRRCRSRYRSAHRRHCLRSVGRCGHEARRSSPASGSSIARSGPKPHVDFSVIASDPAPCRRSPADAIDVVEGCTLTDRTRTFSRFAGTAPRAADTWRRCPQVTLGPGGALPPAARCATAPCRLRGRASLARETARLVVGLGHGGPAPHGSRARPLPRRLRRASFARARNGASRRGIGSRGALPPAARCATAPPAAFGGRASPAGREMHTTNTRA